MSCRELLPKITSSYSDEYHPPYVEHLPHEKPQNDPTDRLPEENPPKRKKRDSSIKLFPTTELSEAAISHFKDISSLTTVDIPNQQNAISGKKLKEKFQNVFNAKYEDNVEKAIKSLTLKENDMLIITGSLYLAGEILKLN